MDCGYAIDFGVLRVASQRCGPGSSHTQQACSPFHAGRNPIGIRHSGGEKMFSTTPELMVEQEPTIAASA
jgi:hypothetical protein